MIGIKSASFLNQASCYQVETRARVIMLDIASFDANRSLQRRTSSLISHTKDHPAVSQSREHGGLMSWPEQFSMPTQPHEHPVAETDDHANNFSLRAMQLSMYGSMVCSYHFLNCLSSFCVHTTFILCL